MKAVATYCHHFLPAGHQDVEETALGLVSGSLAPWPPCLGQVHTRVCCWSFPLHLLAPFGISHLFQSLEKDFLLYVCICVCVCVWSFYGRSHSIWKFIPRLGTKLELQLPAYTTATATEDCCLVFDLHHSPWQC